MSHLSPQQVKKALIEAGFEVFRTKGEEITLAERPRENLIMDSGVRIKVGAPYELRVILRAQKADYPNEDEAHLFARVREIAAAVTSNGFAEEQATASPVRDPGDAARTLDTFYEIVYVKRIPTFEAALEQLKFAMGLEKRA